VLKKSAILSLVPLYSHAKVGAQLGIPHRTVSNLVHRAQERESLENIPRPGRPRKLSDAAVCYLVRHAESETRIPFKELRNLSNIEVNEQTIRRQLQEEGIRRWRAVKCPLLMEQHAKKHLAWARAHRHWTVDDWKRIIWSDESAVQCVSRQIHRRSCVHIHAMLQEHQLHLFHRSGRCLTGHPSKVCPQRPSLTYRSCNPPTSGLSLLPKNLGPQPATFRFHISCSFATMPMVLNLIKGVC